MTLVSLKLLENFYLNEFDKSLSMDVVFDRLFRVLINKDESFVESICSKELAQIIWSVGVEAARKKLDSELFSKELENIEITFKSPLESAYNKYSNQLYDAISTIGWDYPKIVGLDWSILSVIESNESVEIEEPLAEITLKTLATGENSIEKFTFLCNKNQLQDLRWKVKEALNFVQKTASKNK